LQLDGRNVVQHREAQDYLETGVGERHRGGIAMSDVNKGQTSGKGGGIGSVIFDRS
jgi:hypothetical protein